MGLHIRRILLLAVVALAFASPAKSDSVFGVPVIANGSSTQAVPSCPSLEGQSCYNPGTGAINFFIPLNSSSVGVFGHTSVPGGTSGTFSDSGDGVSSALTMYLRFAPIDLPVNSASLNFAFGDLDLKKANDPHGFLESVRFYGPTGSSLTPWITTMGQSGGGALPYSVTGNNNWQTIFFPDITSIIEDPFFVKLKFGSDYDGWGTNTSETLIATLISTPSESNEPPSQPPTQVPEPSTMFLTATGLFALANRIRRWQLRETA